MKIYIKKFKLPSISNDIEYKKIVNNKTFLLTHYGKIEVTPNSLKTFILENSHVSEVENFIKDYNCFFSQENWKYSGKTQIVPTEHEPICIVYESYEITEKLHFVLEKKDEEIIWIDMESGIRSNINGRDVFDINKAFKCILKAENYILK